MEQNGSGSGLPIARGAQGEIILVMDSSAWKGELGDEIRETFTRAMPGLPQPEPYFDLKYVSPFALNRLLRNSRNMMYVTTLDDESAAGRRIKSYFTESSIQRIQEDESLFMYPKKNEFARGQDVLYLFGNTEEELISNLQEYRSRVRSFFFDIEMDRLKKELYDEGEQRAISKQLLQERQFSIRVPYGFETVPLDDNPENFVWIRQLDQKVDKSIMIYYQDYTSESVFQPDSIMALRSRIGRKYVADNEDVYMTRQELVPVEFDTVTFNGKYAIEARGLWKLSNNSMGGPFLSYTFVDEELGRLYYLEGLVYAPSVEKRPYIREMEAILETFRTRSENKPAS